MDTGEFLYERDIKEHNSETADSGNDSCKPCLSLVDFPLPEFPPGRKNVSLSEMIDVVDQLIRINSAERTSVSRCHVISWFEKLYALQIKETIGSKCLEDTKRIVEAFPEIPGNEWIECKNLYEALKDFHKLADESDEGYLKRLITIDRCILDIHKIIVKPGGGVFSTSQRHGEHKGIYHKYPKYDSVEDARSRVQSMVDLHNPFVGHIKNLYQENPRMAIERILKLSSLLLRNVTWLHPFGDGNGRLARLLCSYTMSLVNPFPTPVYGLFSPSNREEYLDALIEAQKDGGSIDDLVGLVVEANYHTWKIFHKAVEMDKIGEDWQKLLIELARPEKEAFNPTLEA